MTTTTTLGRGAHAAPGRALHLPLIGSRRSGAFSCASRATALGTRTRRGIPAGGTRVCTRVPGLNLGLGGLNRGGIDPITITMTRITTAHMGGPR